MKFTKEEAIKDLKAKFKNGKDKDLDLARTIEEVVDNTLALIGDNEELELSAFVSNVEKSISSGVGLARHVASNAVTSKDEEIERLKKQIKVEPHNDDDDTDDKSSKYVKELEKRLKALEDKEAEDKKSQKVAQLRKDLFEAIKKGGVADEEWINDTLADVSITEDLDVNEKADHFVKRYNKYHSETPPNVSPRSGGGSGVDKTNPVLEDVKAKIKANRAARGY